MISILGFLVILAPLVVVHELGHFLFAKLFNVKAEAFSVGFGPRIFKKQIGETEFRVSAIPLGGYVKLLGEEPGVDLDPELRHRSLQHQARWKRFFIFFGGPLFNFIYAILVFMAILAIGEPKVANTLSRVIQDSPAEHAGLKSGDTVIEIDQKPIKRFDDITLALLDFPGKTLSWKVEREGKGILNLSVPTNEHEGYSQFGESKKVGFVDGIMPYPRSTKVGVSNPASEAAKSGVQTGDEVVSINDKPISSYEQLESLYENLPSGTFASVLIKTVKGESKTISFKIPARKKNLETDFGLYSSELFIDKTIEKSPAESGGIKTGDRLLKTNDETVMSFFQLKDQIQKSGEKTGKVKISWERDGKLISETLIPNATTERDPALNKVTQYTIGIIPLLAYGEPRTVIERVLNPFMLVYQGTERMIIFTYRNLVSIGKMFKGEVSVSTLGGPILIGKLAGESLSKGLISFLTTMAVLSVGLGILNVLPVPVLDGGHILLLLVEWIRKKPLSLKQMERFQQVGLTLILCLMVVVMKNDITRLPFFK